MASSARASLLAALTSDPSRSAIFLDYDGTLAPIVLDPTGASPTPGVGEVLERLSARFGSVTIISGRPVAFLGDQLGLFGVQLVGLYGMERLDDAGQVHVTEEVERWRPVVDRATAAAVRAAPAGVEVEPKGISVTLHWRSAPTSAPWVTEFAAQQVAQSGLVAQPGRMAIELRPPVATDKGTVVTELSRSYTSALYIGDDFGDLPAFEALARLSTEGKTVVRVAVVDDESPAQVAEAADITVPGTEGVLAFLRQLADWR